MERTALSQQFPIGSPLADFTLPATDGLQVSSRSYFAGAKAGLVAFICNHCPYVKGSDHELLEIARRYGPEGLRVLAISSNDATKYPEDSFEKMREKAITHSFPFPYLYDESQQIAHNFDAQCTPEFYLFNEEMTLVYHGAINDSPRDPAAVSKHYLRDAVEQVIKDGRATPAFFHPTGCSIKWKG
jgi:peroxiredoxin